jgi:uncharacterized protein YggT (Ycf19 family)
LPIGVDSMTAPSVPDPQAEVAHEAASLRRHAMTLAVARVAAYIAYAWVMVSLIILAFGFFLLLFAANPDAPFTQWVYRHLTDTMEPFRGIFPQQSTESGSTLDVSILFAMFVYTLIALAVRSVIDWLTFRRDRLEHRLRQDTELMRRAQARTAATQPEQLGPSDRRTPPQW